MFRTGSYAIVFWLLDPHTRYLPLRKWFFYYHIAYYLVWFMAWSGSQSNETYKTLLFRSIIRSSFFTMESLNLGSGNVSTHRCPLSDCINFEHPHGSWGEIFFFILYHCCHVIFLNVNLTVGLFFIVGSTCCSPVLLWQENCWLPRWRGW